MTEIVFVKYLYLHIVMWGYLVNYFMYYFIYSIFVVCFIAQMTLNTFHNTVRTQLCTYTLLWWSYEINFCGLGYFFVHFPIFYFYFTILFSNSCLIFFSLFLFNFIFIFQGISAKNVTLGVPRLNEILNVAKNIKTPSVTINIYRADDEEEASDLISQVRKILLNLLLL